MHNYVMTKYDLHEIPLSVPVDTIRVGNKYGTTELKPGPLVVAYQIEPIILIYIQMNQECGKPMTRFYFIYCANYLINGSTLVTVMNIFHKSDSK